MQLPIEVAFRQCLADPSLDAAVRRWVERLERTGLELARATVVIEEGAWRRTAVRVELAVPAGAPIAATAAHADPYVAIGDAFRVARRRLLARGTAVALGGATYLTFVR